jgi:hypothetical protein
MPSHRPISPLPSRLSRALAWLSAGLTLLLALSTASPDLHAWLHAQAHQDATHACADHPAHASDDRAKGATSTAPSGNEPEDRCAVVMFSQGVEATTTLVGAQPCEGILRAVNYRAFERLALAQPRFLHLPPQAPPAV